ncbi:MAG: hypothetical protein ACQETE_11075 [Bacteroidota bacterium]
MDRRSFIQKGIFLISAMSINPSSLFKSLSLDFEEFIDLWDKFIDNPDPRNSKNIYQAIPTYDSYEREKKIKVGNKIDNSLITLEKYVLSDNQHAVSVTFNLISITDGSVSQFIDIILGKYIHVNPTNFLAELKKHFHIVSFSKVLGNYGLDFVDEFELQNIETRKRIDALKTVTDKNLEALQKRCIRELKTKFIPQERIDSLKGFDNSKNPIA